ncbi:MAG: FHA domain-containing protein [Pseudomonadaceae bacterium]|nr:FHA domain-containing protein [Pseudomonadaceae bacterium]
MLKLQFKDSRQPPVWLADEKITLGQDARNHLVLPDHGVSLFHAEIRREDGHYFLSDCASEAGTWVNGERVSGRYQIRADDSVQIGPVALQFIDPLKTVAKPDNSKKWFLQVIQGENEGKKYPLSGSMTFGRSVKCELCFNDVELSRRHCEFFFKDGVLEVKDLGSANGVLLNRAKVSAATLQAGDQLQMGAVVLLVIGPKVEVVQAQDEDATVFMPMAPMTRIVKGSAASLPGPAQMQKVPAPAVATSSTSKVVTLVVLLAAVAVALWAVRGLF